MREGESQPPRHPANDGEKPDAHKRLM